MLLSQKNRIAIRKENLFIILWHALYTDQEGYI